MNDLDARRLDNLAEYIRRYRPDDGTNGGDTVDVLLTLEEVGAYLKVTKMHAWRLTQEKYANGEPLPVLKLSPGAVRVRLSELDAWIERRTAAANETLAERRRNQ
jgi:predicted DNA-binding transcriptional regulator AlpA